MGDLPPELYTMPLQPRVQGIEIGKAWQALPDHPAASVREFVSGAYMSNAYLTFSTAAGTSPRSVLVGVTANVDFCNRPDGIREHVIGCQP